MYCVRNKIGSRNILDDMLSDDLSLGTENNGIYNMHVWRSLPSDNTQWSIAHVQEILARISLISSRNYPSVSHFPEITWHDRSTHVRKIIYFSTIEFETNELRNRYEK